MNRTALIDTNVLIDIAQPERPHHYDAFCLLDELEVNALKAYASSTSLKDVYYVLAKCAPEPRVRMYLQKLLDIIEIIPVDESICRLALASDEPDFEDGIVRACAELNGINFILSRDENAFRTSSVRRLTPAEYMELFVHSERIGL